ncbi:orph-M7 [Microplitis demolitor]|nr:orph-M7 [Microplitis demolitor]
MGNIATDVDDITLLVTVKPIIESLLKYINIIADNIHHSQPINVQNDEKSRVAKLQKYRSLRDVYLKILQDEMMPYLELYKQKVEIVEDLEGPVIVNKRIFNNVIIGLAHIMMMLKRDIE